MTQFEYRRRFSFLVLLSLLFFFLVTKLQAQSFSIQKTYGTPCVGTDMGFALTGGSGCTTTWNISGNYTIVSQSSTTLQVRWNSSTSAATVSATYSSCSSPNGAAGTVYYSSFPVSDVVTPSVILSASATTVCENSSVSFTASPTNGGNFPSYSWSINGTAVSGITTATYSTSSLPPGTNTVICTLNTSASCPTKFSASDSKTINITPRPVDGTISASVTNICLGQAITINGSGGTGSLHYWCSTDGGTSWNVFADSYVGQSSFSYTPTQAGTYRFHLRNQTACGFCWDTGNTCPTYPFVDVVVSPNPPASISPSGPIPINAGGSALLSANTGTNYQYKWQLNGSDIANATNATYSASLAGNYSVKITVNGCQAISNTVTVATTCISPPVIITTTPKLASLTTTMVASTQTLSFDGIDDYIQVGRQPNLKFVSTFTIEAWINPTGPGSDPTYGGVIVSKEGEYEVARFANGTIQWAIANPSPGWTWINTGIIAPLNKWSHIAITYQAGVVKTYLNGVLGQTYSGSGNITPTQVTQNDFRIGSRQGLSQYFKGEIDEVRVWNSVRSQAQVQAHLSVSPATNTYGLVGYWKLNEGSGKSTADATSNRYMGALTSGPSWQGVATSYVWSPASGLSSATGVTVDAALPRTNTNYTVNATFSTGCTSYGVVTLGGNDYNYIITNNVQQAGVTTDAQVQALAIAKDQLSQSVTYLDGLSQAVQKVSTQASPTKQDIVTPAVYDALGRQVKSYLSYTAGTDGFYKSDALSVQPTFYQNSKGDAKSFAESRVENSPLSRVIEQGSVGTSWQLAATPGEGKTQKINYLQNSPSEIRNWTFNLSNKKANTVGFYQPNTLSVTQITDEHGYRTWTYKDKSDRLVAKRVQKLNPGLVAYYPFSGNANDGSFNGNNATTTGVSLTTDRFDNANNAYQFSGSSYIRLPTANLKLANYTYSFWAKPASIPASGTFYSILSIGSPVGDQLASVMNTYAGYSASTGWAGGGYNVGGAGTTAWVGTLPTVNTWYHLTITRNNNNVILYVNGVAVQTVSTTGKMPYYGAGQLTAILGARWDLSQFYQGVLDEVRIYNRALSAAEVTNLYNADPTTNVSSDLITYYIYDDFGNLRFTVPPEATNNLASVNYAITYNDSFCQKWLFAYDYDERWRVTEKLVPGGGITWLAYDPADRLILSQDAAHRRLNQWLFTKYDILGRTVMNGRYTYTAATQAAMQAAVDAYYTTYPTRTYYENRSNTDFANLHGYTNQAFPVIPSPNSASGQLYIISYFDDYDFDYNGVNGTATETAKGEPAYINFGVPYQSIPGRTKGKPTGNKVLVLGTSTWLTSAVYYDERGREIQSQDENYNNAAIVANKGRNVEVVATSYEGNTDRVKQTERRHCYALSDNSHLAAMTIKESFEYDAASRLTASFIQVGSGLTEKLAAYSYNETGEMVQKTLGNNLQTVDYNYNIRGWLKAINGGVLSGNDIFAMSFIHNDAGGTVPQFNGNLSRYDWISATDNVKRTYQFRYDGLNRLLTADYSSTVAAEHFSVSTTYNDDNGNIKTLNRQNLITRNGNAADDFGYVDQLQYTYDGNQLTAVEDGITTPSAAKAFTEAVHTAGEYTYDLSGKLLTDKNKGLTTPIIYNDLDLPSIIQTANNDYITNVYDATGGKLQMTVTSNGSPANVTKYIGGIVYLNDVPQFIPTSEGRILSPQASGTSNWVYEYFYRDHLGDLRVAFRQAAPILNSTATMEPTNNVAWSNVSTPVRNNERAATGSYSAKLTPSNPLGPWKTVKVEKGDVITVSASASYTSTTTPNNAAVNLIAYVNGLPAQTPESGNQKSWLSIGLSITPLASNSSQANVPKAYLKYVLQMDDQTVTQSKRLYLTTAALNGWEPLSMSYTAETNGYIQVLVANESDQPVWFDDVSITVTPALGTQETHYDPWGLELAGIEQVGSPEHRYKFQDKESIPDLALYWQDFGARYYDAQLGRWHVGDPANQFASPYLAMGNNPVTRIDPDGKFVFAIPLAIGIAAVIGGTINVVANMNTITGPGQFFGYFVAGAVVGGAAAYAAPAVFAAFGSGALGGAVLGAASGFVGTIGNSGIAGEGIGEALQKGASGALSGFLTGGLMQGISSAIGGRDFFTGRLNNGLIDGIPDITRLERPGAPFGDLDANLPRPQPQSFTPNEPPIGSQSTRMPIVKIERTSDFANRILPIEPIKLTTSSTSLAPSRTYTIYDRFGKLYKFGVTDADFVRMNQSLAEAGKGATAKWSSIMPKNQAHLMEKYLRTIHYNSTGQWNLPGMKVPYPVNLNTGKQLPKP